ncbi:MAG: hypothetical protein Q8N44_18870 [Rubrivivax sp.]|nr:hypothetical protein [Rubrivivax sp.]
MDGTGQVAASTTNAANGNLLLHPDFPGGHALRTAPDQVTKLRLAGALDVPANGDFVSGQDFELRLTAPRAGG